MSKIINLRQARKDRARSTRRAQGDANAAKFGEAKHLQDARRAEKARAEAQHEQHKRDD